MKIIQQERMLPIVNLDEILSTKPPVNSKHGKLLPHSFRAIFCGPSGCGKTNAMLSLLFNPNGAKFKNVYVYSKSLYQPKYQLLQQVLDSVKGVGYFPFKENDDVISPSEAKNHSIFIFDDVSCDKQQKIREYFSMCRHKDIDVAYLCQTFSKIPKQLVRDNSNLLVLFRQDEMNLKHVFDEHVSPDMSFDQFEALCSECWNSNQYGAMVIAKTFDMNAGRYRNGFDEFIRL